MRSNWVVKVFFQNQKVKLEKSWLTFNDIFGKVFGLIRLFWAVLSVISLFLNLFTYVTVVRVKRKNEKSWFYVT